ncbi:LuxR C-terminal-related transcriptional regulator, partial [Klebsiella pneumoniae]|uniref:helix-turn-helix domain-containing protein n=1 Tax=Klebsiella pneumoniae TaxID=573 RepID=UPI003A8833DB
WSARGKTSGEIATILGLSKRTVDFHIDNARQKLGVPADVPVFAILPGSRVSEIDYMAAVFFQTALSVFARLYQYPRRHDNRPHFLLIR